MRKLRLRNGRPVICTDCGFLTIAGREVNEAERILVHARSGGLPAELERLDCARGQWIDYDLTYVGGEAGLLLEQANKTRRCTCYLRYVPGWSPDGHKALLLRRQDRVADRVSNALFAILGAALALIVQWAAKRFGLG